MQPFKKRYRGNKPVVETDFVNGGGWFIDLLRAQDSRLGFIRYQIDSQKVDLGREVELEDRVIVPPEEGELVRHVRVPECFYEYSSVAHLGRDISSLLSRCLDLNARHLFLLTCFVLCTWVADRLPLAPYIALVGLPESGKTTALKALHLLGRRGLLTSDLTSAAFYRVCDKLMPTLLIDETATAGHQRTLFHLLRSGNTPDFVALRDTQSYRNYCPKVVSWTELPDDDALNSRCIVIPMLESSRNDLLRTTDPKIVADARRLQGRLLRFRFQQYNTLQLSQIPGSENLRSRNRDIYEALALPIAEYPKACALLQECMEQQHIFQRQPLPPNQSAVLETLFQQIHVHADKGTFAIRDLTVETNLILKRTGERFRLNYRGVGTVLTTFGFHKRKRLVRDGWSGLIAVHEREFTS
jgi:hypothetical protein